MPIKSKKDIVELFGYAADDTSETARSLWRLGACPFINKSCTKYNHDQTIIYGTCTVTSSFGDCIICPNRLYANSYQILRDVAKDAFGTDHNFLLYDQYISKRESKDEFLVALGQNSGKEVKLGRGLSMDWVIAKVKQGKLLSYVGAEVQSIDITGNYRDAWHAYSQLPTFKGTIPSSAHGLNWANVHKRLIPQLIRKGIVYSKSSLCTSGIYFLLPEIVYQKFEEIIGSDIPTLNNGGSDIVTVHTFKLSSKVEKGKMRDLVTVRKLRFKLDEFSKRFISGDSLPSSAELDNAVKLVLGI